MYSWSNSPRVCYINHWVNVTMNIQCLGHRDLRINESVIGCSLIEDILQVIANLGKHFEKSCVDSVHLALLLHKSVLCYGQIS